MLTNKNETSVCSAMFKILGVSILVLCISFVCAITVCDNFWDYNWSYFSKNCFDDPVIDLNISEIIRSWDFTAEEHYITTEDGYKLLLERAHSKITKETPIIIVHGIAMNAVGFVNRGEKSLALILGNLGYDVWLLNYRGTKYSRGHVSLTPNQDDYWKFSVNELGVHDVRTAIKHVNEITKKQPIYIGYSMGSTGFFVYSTTFPEEARKLVKGMIGLAPVINYKDIKSAVRLVSPAWPRIKPLMYTLFHGELFPGYSNALRPLLGFTGGIYTIQYFVNIMFGDDYDQMDPLTYPQFILQLTDTTGAETFSHYLQIYEAGVFQKYDYGKEKNLEVYGTEKPPAYDMSKVPVPVALFVGENDWLATPTNAEQIYMEIKQSVRCGYHVVDFKKWSHIDFLVAKDIMYYLYRHVIDKIEDINSRKCAP